MNKQKSIFEVNGLIKSILSAPLPPVRNANLRRECRKTYAVEIRKLFKDLGLKGISVTAPNYSMARGVDIGLPWSSEHRDYPGHGRYCEYCLNSLAAIKRTEEIILAAFPNLDNRGDSLMEIY